MEEQPWTLPWQEGWVASLGTTFTVDQPGPHPPSTQPLGGGGGQTEGRAGGGAACRDRQDRAGLRVTSCQADRWTGLPPGTSWAAGVTRPLPAAATRGK